MSSVSYCLTFLFIASVSNRDLFERPKTFADLNGLISAFVDFNFDRVTDVFLITEDGCSVQLAAGYESQPYLRLEQKIKCSFGNHCLDKVIGVIPADFSGQDYMDVLVVTTYDRFGVKRDKSLKLWFFRGNQTNLDCNTTVPLVTDIKSFPLLLDYDGDMITDFIVETRQCRKELWTKLKPRCLTEMFTNQSMSYPNSNAFADLSNPRDYRPDIFISGSDYIEYWFSDKNGFTDYNVNLFKYPNRTKYQYIGQSSFADINFDGLVDHIIPVCEKLRNNHCIGPQIVVLSNHIYDYEWIEILEIDNNLNLTFSSQKVFQYLEFYINLKVGDINADGYPDIVTMMKENQSTQRVVMLKNSEGGNAFGRQFHVEWFNQDEPVSFNISSQTSLYVASLFDFDEDGKLDILVGTYDNDNNFYVTYYLNTGKSSSNFLKVLVSSGICHSDCPHMTSPLVGAQVCYSPSEGRRVGCNGQLSQTAHFTLQLPFVLFGLGDIPNFIENMTISIPSGRGKTRRQTWEEIIPDSRIVIIPYPANKTDEWVQKLYLDPKYFAFPTLITLTSICCLLVVIIAILHKRDLRQDIIEHKEYKKHWL